ncbi:MAG TPA: PilN domain-containing protein [Roseiarcus sp.]|jgi:general secretion pathway protein L
MNALQPMIAWLSRWIDDVASALLRIGEIVRFNRKVQLVEQSDGGFLIQTANKRSVGAPLRIEEGQFVGPVSAKTRAILAGSQIEVILKASRFIFRPLELPSRANEFLDGVVRAQIDRLTPWSQRDAAFGWSTPSPLGADRMIVTVAATAVATITPIVKALADRRADAISVSTVSDASGANPPIMVFAQRAGAELRMRRLRRKLIALLIVTCVATGLGASASIVVGNDLDAERMGLERKIAERHAALISGRGSIADEAVAALEARKRATPAGVIVIEALSQTLPDDTYLNELRIEDGKVQIAGLTRDAPALIKLIEQSQHFTHATFFAPTTRAPTDNGERFHIEAHIEPVFPTPQ